jgi:hypothetical protein
VWIIVGVGLGAGAHGLDYGLSVGVSAVQVWLERECGCSSSVA